MGTLITLVSLAVALSILVFVHELGHYVAAKRSGVVVEEFGFGYPPRFISFWHTKGRLVIGGETIVIPRKFTLPKGLQTFSRVVFETETDDKGRRILTQIEEVDPNDPRAATAAEIELLDPGTLFSVNAIPFGGFAKMLGEEDPSYPGSLASKSKLTRIVVLGAGSTMNFVMAVVFFALAMGLGAPAVADPENAVATAVSPGSPAEAAGILAGDIILKADDADILTMQNLIEYAWAQRGEEIALTVQRGNDLLTIVLVPRFEPPEGEGPIGIALGPRVTIKHYKWHEAILESLKQTGTMVGLIITVPVQVVRGLIPVEMARPVGPVGIGQIVGDTVQYSIDSGWWYPVMQMMGALSVAIGLTNLLPLPGLDGGRILFVIIEGIRGRRIDPAKEGLVHLIGLMLMVALLLFITWQDVVNPIPSLDWSSLF